MKKQSNEFGRLVSYYLEKRGLSLTKAAEMSMKRANEPGSPRRPWVSFGTLRSAAQNGTIPGPEIIFALGELLASSEDEVEGITNELLAEADIWFLRCTPEFRSASKEVLARNPFFGAVGGVCAQLAAA